MKAMLDPIARHQASEVLKRPVVGSFGIIWETACRQLTMAKVIAQAFTAGSLPRTRLVTAIACKKVLLFVAFHGELQVSF